MTSGYQEPKAGIQHLGLNEKIEKLSGKSSAQKGEKFVRHHAIMQYIIKLQIIYTVTSDNSVIKLHKCAVASSKHAEGVLLVVPTRDAP